MTESAMFESDVDLNESIPNSGRSNATTDDELYDQMMKVPIEAPIYLIPENCPDETEAIEHMMKCLNRRYQNNPVIFVGSLKEALKESFKAQRLDERSPMLIYVNNDKSVYTNLFCKQILCHEKTIEFLLQNHLLWAWDITFGSNCNKLNEVFKNVFSSSANQITFKNENVDQYPLILGVYRNTQGDYVYERLFDGTRQQATLTEFLNLLKQFKERFFESERALEQRRETIKREMAERAASMRHPHFKRYHSTHPHGMNPRDYRSYLSSDPSHALHDPMMRMEIDEYLSQHGMHAFERLHREEEADDEDDDPEQTPTVERPEPKFQQRPKNP